MGVRSGCLGRRENDLEVATKSQTETQTTVGQQYPGVAIGNDIVDGGNWRLKGDKACTVFRTIVFVSEFPQAT